MRNIPLLKPTNADWQQLLPIASHIVKKLVFSACLKAEKAHYEKPDTLDQVLRDLSIVVKSERSVNV